MSLISRPMIKEAVKVGDKIYDPKTNSMRVIKEIVSDGPSIGASQMPFISGIGGALGVGGNALASNISGSRSALKSLLAILAGAGGALGSATLAAPFSDSAIGQAGLLAAIAGGGMGSAYVLRRLLDKFKNKYHERPEGEDRGITINL